MPNISPFGEWLKKWRRSRGLTQKQLAAKAGCAQSIVSMYERGVKQEKSGDFMRPETDLIERLATALNRPVEEARALAGYLPSPVPPTRREIEDMFASSGGIVINPNSGNPKIATIDTETAREYARLIAEELAKVFPQPPTKANNDK